MAGAKATDQEVRPFNLFWILNLFAMLVAVIWIRDLRSHFSFALLILVMFISHLWHGDSLREIGFWPRKIINERLFGLIGLALVSGWLLWIFVEPKKPLAFWDVIVKIVGGSCWGLLQQYTLNSFVVNRLAGFFGNARDRRIPWIAAGMFSLIHAPNWFLMAVTFVGGHLCVKVFLRDRNLYFLGLAHGIVSFLLLAFVPDSVSRGLRIGFGYFL